MRCAQSLLNHNEFHHRRALSVITTQTQTSDEAVRYRARAAGACPLIRNRRRSHPRTIRLIESSPSSAIIGNKHQANEAVRQRLGGRWPVQCRLTVSDIASIRHCALRWGDTLVVTARPGVRHFGTRRFKSSSRRRHRVRRGLVG